MLFLKLSFAVYVTLLFTSSVVAAPAPAGPKDPHHGDPHHAGHAADHDLDALHKTHAYNVLGNHPPQKLQLNPNAAEIMKHHPECMAHYPRVSLLDHLDCHASRDHKGYHVQAVHEDPAHQKSHPVFKGKILAHTTEAMTPQQLHVYSQHAQKIVEREHPQAAKDHPFVYAAVHNPGDTHVTFRTQPRGKDKANQEAKNDVVGQARQKVGARHEHADTAVIRDRLEEAGIAHDPVRAAEMTKTMVFGVGGEWQPKDQHGKPVGPRQPIYRACHPCTNTLNELKVQHRR